MALPCRGGQRFARQRLGRGKNAIEQRFEFRSADAPGHGDDAAGHPHHSIARREQPRLVGSAARRLLPRAPARIVFGQQQAGARLRQRELWVLAVGIPR